MTAKKEPPVSARQLRRHYALLTKVAEKVLTIGYDQQTMLADQQSLMATVADMRAEFGERLRMIELELEQFGAAIPILPRWTAEQRAAFQAGEDAKTDDRMREGFRALHCTG